MTSLSALHRPDAYPRSSTYDPQFLVEHCMGPHPLWLLEDLLRDCVLEPGMRVLDLGCGMGVTSIFLAREFGVDVVAADWWISPEENQARIAEAGLTDRVRPIRAEAHALPFEKAQFDAIIAIDSYHYFGTDDLYLGYLAPFLAPRGQLAIAVPAVQREIRDLGGIPAHLRSTIGWEALSFHTAEWWRFHWDQTQLVEVTSARTQEEGWRDWKLWCEVCAEHSPIEAVRVNSLSTVHMLEEDQGEHMAFALITARAPTEALSAAVH